MDTICWVAFCAMSGFSVFAWCLVASSSPAVYRKCSSQAQCLVLLSSGVACLIGTSKAKRVSTFFKRFCFALATDNQLLISYNRGIVSQLFVCSNEERDGHKVQSW